MSFKGGNEKPVWSSLEMEIVQDEHSTDVALAITDFATDETRQERELIWDNQIQYLISVVGA
jgi:hypothetical protein